MDNYGAVIERGYVSAINGNGYMVKSYSRDGVETRAVPIIGTLTIAVNDRVYFFMFEDGTGGIIGKF